ncbi:MAG TPA: hypothetical protein VHZ78_12560 [Rhizomicrobium sp.]|nr:hypothetical protein [Rhizomicrobium sp.]
MSDAVLTTADEYRAADSRAYFEQRLFVLSPFGTFTTALIIFVVLFGLFVIAAEIHHVKLISETPQGLGVESLPRVAFTLALMLCAVLFIQRHTRVKERLDRAAFEAVLKPGAMARRNLVQLTPTDARLPLFTGIGIVLGIVLSWPFFGAAMFALPHPPYAVFAWFVLVNTLLVTSFTRGIELSRSGSKSTSEAIDHDLVVDLLRIDLLAVWGRSAARFALIWFTVSAVSCLFFVGGGLSAFNVSMVAGLLAIGIWMFVRPMERVHHRIRAAKHAELERIRGQIDGLRDAAVNDASAATRLQGLLAYETRIAAAPEWPFDQTTLVRVGASALILTVPWFGQAIAAYVVDHMSHIAN